jgi:2-(1,2-epoxy-1,2-dihydrophenyl)acetyl-CoA isomerase
MSYTTILFDVADSLATLTLNRPDKLNAFTAEMHAELRDALGRIADPAGGCRALLITGAGRGFCAGQDLTQRQMTENTSIDLGETIDKQFNPLIRKLRSLPLPVVGAINGVAAGAGMSLALACDITLAARSASFLQAFAKLGLVPDSGSTYFLPRLAGDARARGLAMLAEKISAEQAAGWGLIWKVVDDDKLLSEATALARHLATQPTKGLAMIKHALDQSSSNTLDQQLDLERDLQRTLGHSADYREGVSAFLQKRPAKFTGR